MSTTLYNQKKDELLQLMRSYKFPGNQLPIETELTSMISCSRSMLREILKDLEQHGYITKRHSVGNFVHPRAFSASMRSDVYPRFVDLIAQGGYTPSICVLEHSDDTSYIPESVRKTLELMPEESVNYTERVYYADQTPAVLCRCYIPNRIMLRRDGSAAEDPNSMPGNYFKVYCNQEISQMQKQYFIEQADERMARVMNVPVGKPLQLWWESYFNFHDEVICLCHVYLNLDIMELSTFSRYQQFEDADFFLRIAGCIVTDNN